VKRGFFSTLSNKQKEAIGLLQVGTFLEYFDLMLYVHMAVLLNEIFFPKTDDHTTALLTAFAFCSTYVLRPVGALIFGYIGDTIGRKATVIITTTMMSISCVIMANLPTYAEIGIAAAWVVTTCRIVQGLSSMGEIIGAQVYVAEITKIPQRYPAVAMIAVASAVGGASALGVATLVMTKGMSWRIAFWIGAGIAVVGSIARTHLRETPEFLAQQARKKKGLPPRSFADDGEGGRKTLLSFFLIYCGWPLTFYMVFMYFNPLLKSEFGYSASEIIEHNFYLSLIFLSTFATGAVLSYYIHPMKIIRIRAIVSIPFVLMLPQLIDNCTCGSQIFVLQAMLLILSLASSPTEGVLVKAIPVSNRFTASSVIYAASRAIVYIVTSFGLTYLTKWLGHIGLLVVILPITIGFLWGVNHFEALEAKKKKNSVLKKSVA
jgi:MFS family permease